MADIVPESKSIRPELGEELAVDATPARSYSDGNRNPLSDADTEREIHHKAKPGVECIFGYKLHGTVGP